MRGWKRGRVEKVNWGGRGLWGGGRVGGDWEKVFGRGELVGVGKANGEDRSVGKFC
jgi:hypothetical protein